MRSLLMRTAEGAASVRACCYVQKKSVYLRPLQEQLAYPL